MRFTSLLALALILLAVSGTPTWAQRYGKPNYRQNPNLLKQQAFDEYVAGEFESSAELYKKALDAGIKEYGSNSDFVFDLYYELGTMSLEEGNFTRAARYLPKAVNLKPNSVLARVKLSDLYLMQGKIDQAFGQIRQAQKRNPNSVLAQKQLVKLMMERSKKTNNHSDAANLASTMESFKLTRLTNNLVNGTHSLISQWQKRISGAGNYSPPRVSVAMSTTRPVTQAPVKIKPPQKKKPPKAAPKVKPKAKPAPRKVKPKAKPRPKPVKKVAKTKPKPKPKPKAKPKAVAKRKPKTRRIRKVNGLVPPPPPVLPPIYAPPVSNIKLETKAKVEKKKAPKKKKKVRSRKRRTVPDEPDFILDWASKKTKKAK